MRELTPQAQIPVMKDGDYYLYESNAIAKYLIGDTPTPLYPADAKIRGHIDQWCDWKHGDLRHGALRCGGQPSTKITHASDAGCTGMLRRLLFKDAPMLPAKLKRTFDEVKMERESRQMLSALALLEAQLTKTGAFIVAGTTQPTLADLAVFEEVDQLCLLPPTRPPPTGSDLQASHPNVARWLDRVRNAGLPEFGSIHKIALKRREKHANKKPAAAAKL